jgi:hypothetical protein
MARWAPNAVRSSSRCVNRIGHLAAGGACKVIKKINLAHYKFWNKKTAVKLCEHAEFHVTILLMCIWRPQYATLTCTFEMPFLVPS